MIKDLISNVNYVLDHNEGLAVNVERIGDWLWVSGDPRGIKEELKVLGFFWAKNKKAWYHKGDTSRRTGRGFYKSMTDLRTNKGSENVR
jgi:hypothetical protein